MPLCWDRDTAAVETGLEPLRQSSWTGFHADKKERCRCRRKAAFLKGKCSLIPFFVYISMEKIYRKMVPLSSLICVKRQRFRKTRKRPRIYITQFIQNVCMCIRGSGRTSSQLVGCLRCVSGEKQAAGWARAKYREEGKCLHRAGHLVLGLWPSV